uniref:Uncharacterized protein n=1 Tax=Zea mays TaxID=4577 RepID=A0A804QA70_MAIZE
MAAAMNNNEGTMNIDQKLQLQYESCCVKGSSNWLLAPPWHHREREAGWPAGFQTTGWVGVGGVSGARRHRKREAVGGSLGGWRWHCEASDGASQELQLRRSRRLDAVQSGCTTLSIFKQGDLMVVAKRRRLSGCSGHRIRQRRCHAVQLIIHLKLNLPCKSLLTGHEFLCAGTTIVADVV